MKCESCHKKPARVHLTEIGSKMKKEIHLCDECARQHEASLPPSFGTAPIHEMEGLADTAAGKTDSAAEPKGVCRVCGISFGEFRSTGRLGCPEDYEFFQKGLLPILDRIHGGNEHRGKVPHQAGENSIRQRDLVKLSSELDRAVKSEDYEEAARVRDKIHVLREGIHAD